MIRLLLVCCIGMAVVVNGTFVKRSPQFPEPPQIPGDIPMPPMPFRFARQAPPPPPEGAPQGPPSRLVRQAPPPQEPPKRVVRQLPPPPPVPQMPTGFFDAQDMAEAAAELYGGARKRREARGGGGHMPTKTG